MNLEKYKVIIKLIKDNCKTDNLDEKAANKINQEIDNENNRRRGR